MEKNNFIKLIEDSNIRINETIINLLDIYYRFLIDYNQHTNLTAIKDKESIYLKHFYDSIIISKYVSFDDNKSLIDIGSGAGFPGIVLAIFYPNLRVTCLDSNGKKTNFLKELIKKLELDNVKIINDRAENYAKNHLNEYDYCTARAVAHIDIISNLCIPFIKKDGKVLLLKGDFEAEKSLLKNNINNYNIEKYDIYNYKLDELNKRVLFVLQKKYLTTAAPNYAKLLKENKKNKQ